MKTRLRFVVAGIALLSAVSVVFADGDKDKDKAPEKDQKKPAAAGKSAERKAAPAFRLTDLDGKTQSLKDYKGKLVVLEWTHKDCPGWNRALPTLNKTAEAYAKKGVVWLNIDSTWNQDDDANRKGMKEKNVNRPLLNDKNGKVGHAFDARTTPHMFVIDKDGRIAYDGAIDNRARGDKNVNYVAKALDELIAGKPVSESSTMPYG